MPTTIHVSLDFSHSLVTHTRTMCLFPAFLALYQRRPTYCHWMLYVFIKLQQFHPICCDTQPYSNPIVAPNETLNCFFLASESLRKVTNSADALVESIFNSSKFFFFRSLHSGVCMCVVCRDNVQERNKNSAKDK